MIFKKIQNNKDEIVEDDVKDFSLDIRVNDMPNYKSDYKIYIDSNFLKIINQETQALFCSINLYSLHTIDIKCLFPTHSIMITSCIIIILLFLLHWILGVSLISKILAVTLGLLGCSILTGIKKAMIYFITLQYDNNSLQCYSFTLRMQWQYFLRILQYLIKKYDLSIKINSEMVKKAPFNY